MKKLLLLIGMGLLTTLLGHAEPLKAGAEVPALKPLNEKGEAIDLAAELKTGYGLVFFYPKADTPGCTKQACSLRDAYETLSQKGVKVIGVSRDKPEVQSAFIKKFNLPYSLVADVDGKVCEAFGVPVRAGMFAARQAFLFKEGKLIWHDGSASTSKQAEDVLGVIAKQGS
jgi:peroxiredoxin Q/BCP